MRKHPPKQLKEKLLIKIRTDLFGVNILVINTNPPQGAVSDENGNFRIEKVAIGRHTLRFTYVGYEDAMASEVLVSSGVELTLNMEMTERLANMKDGGW